MLDSIISFPFFLTSLLAGLASSVTSGIIGSYVVVKRIVFISGSISHSVLGGMGIFLYLKRTYGISWLDPLYGALIAAVLSALLIGWMHLKYRQREDTVIAAIWSTGMAIGVICVSLTPGYNVELMNFLFGNILWISKADLNLLMTLAGSVIVITALLHQKFQAVCFDEVEAELRGISTTKYYLLLLTLIAIAVVILIQVVGAILVIAMLTIPAAIASHFAKKLSQMMVQAVLLGAAFTVSGLFTAFYLNWPPGATIALVAALSYTVHLLQVNKKANHWH